MNHHYVLHCRNHILVTQIAQKPSLTGTLTVTHCSRKTAFGMNSRHIGRSGSGAKIDGHAVGARAQPIYICWGVVKVRYCRLGILTCSVTKDNKVLDKGNGLKWAPHVLDVDNAQSQSGRFSLSPLSGLFVWHLQDHAGLATRRHGSAGFIATKHHAA